MNKWNSLCKTNEPEDETDSTSNMDETEKISNSFTYLLFFSLTKMRQIFSHQHLHLFTSWDIRIHPVAIVAMINCQDYWKIFESQDFDTFINAGLKILGEEIPRCVISHLNVGM